MTDSCGARRVGIGERPSAPFKRLIDTLESLIIKNEDILSIQLGYGEQQLNLKIERLPLHI